MLDVKRMIDSAFRYFVTEKNPPGAVQDDYNVIAHCTYRHKDEDGEVHHCIAGLWMKEAGLSERSPMWGYEGTIGDMIDFSKRAQQLFGDPSAREVEFLHEAQTTHDGWANNKMTRRQFGAALRKIEKEYS